MLTASMKGLVALSGLEAMSNGIQFVINEDAGIVKWGKIHLPKLKGLWEFYSGKVGDRTFCSNILFVLWRHYHRFAGILCGAFQCL